MLLEYFFLWQTIFRVFCVQYISHKNNLKNSKKKQNPNNPTKKTPAKLKNLNQWKQKIFKETSNWRDLYIVVNMVRIQKI